MRIKLLGKNLDDIRPLLAARDLLEVQADAEAVITYGGDGALLGAARDFPRLPILAIRDAATAATCSQHEAAKVLDRFVSGKLKLTRLNKLCAESASGVLYGINDLFLHNIDRTSSLRFKVRINGELLGKEVRGDGVCLSSVHGSSAYYRSITQSLFKVGIGLAFSNSTEDVNHLVLDEKSRIEIEIVRGPGLLIADNSREPENIKIGETVELYQSGHTADIIGLEGFMCKKCRLLRHPHKHPFAGMF